jgi:hypothetical protein
MKQQHVGYGYEFGLGSGLDQLGEVVSEMRKERCR